jgi:hypothetical protein
MMNPFDKTFLTRREALGLIGASGAAAALASCGGSSPTSPSSTYLRGIQTTNSSGEVTFTTIYPGWYQGRATHIHVAVTINGLSSKVTPIAFPESVSNSIHATGVYASRGRNPLSNASDGIFADGLSSEPITPSGDVASGYTATFQVAIAL